MNLFNDLDNKLEHKETNRRNNIWFTQLRWYAVLLLICFILSIKFIFSFEITNTQLYSYISVTSFIVSYNSFFVFIKRKREIFEQRESLLQIILDLFSLSIMVYFSGGIEAPFFMLYIFHMIIGSILLPKRIMYSIAISLIIFLGLFSYLEYQGVIKHQFINGLYPFQLYKSPSFIYGFISAFTFVIMISIKLTSRIVGELYSSELQLRRALIEVDEAEKSKQKYLMAVVHELKSPIAAATTNLDLVLGNYAGDVSSTAVEKLMRSKERLSDAIDNINNILRFSQFRLMNKIEIESLNLTELFNDIILKYRSLVEKKNIQIKLDAKPNVIYLGDKLLLNLAFSNIIGNSVKYSSEKGKISVEIKDNISELYISISDNGIGIPKEDLPKIFEEYYRASNVKSIEGTGTGLSAINRIIESHKGMVNIKSPSPLGTVSYPGTQFIINLPKN